MKNNLQGAVTITIAASVLTTQARDADKLREMNLGGYLSVCHSQAPASFNAGYSFCTAAWPLRNCWQDGHDHGKTRQ